MAEYRGKKINKDQKTILFLMERILVVFKTEFLLVQNSPKKRFPGILMKSKRRNRDKIYI